MYVCNGKGMVYYVMRVVCNIIIYMYVCNNIGILGM